MHVTFLTNQAWQVGAKSTGIESKTQHESIIDKWQHIKKAKVNVEYSDVGFCQYSICTTFIPMLFFSTVRYKNGTTVNCFHKICLGEREEGYGTFLIQ